MRVSMISLSRAEAWLLLHVCYEPCLDGSAVTFEPRSIHSDGFERLGDGPVGTRSVLVLEEGLDLNRLGLRGEARGGGLEDAPQQKLT